MKTVAYYRHRLGETREVADDGRELWYRVIRHQPGYQGGPVPTRWESSRQRELAGLDASWRGAWTRITMCSRRRR